MNHDQLRIKEIFYSLQGESSKTGLPTIFIRLTGCPLRCSYCDTAYAFHGGSLMSFEDILNKLKKYSTKHVCVTGGEPLAQKNTEKLLTLLADNNFLVSIETSGERDISKVDKRIMIVMDLKTPDSNEAEKNRYTNLEFLKSSDQIKFVICSRNDYLWSRDTIKKYNLTQRAEVLFSPSYNDIKPVELAQWILEDELNVRLQIQLHKILWNDTPGR